MHRPKSNQLVFGIRAIIEAIDAGKEIETLYIQQGLTGGLYNELKKMVIAHEIKMQTVPVEKLNRITAKNHQGAIAFISPISYSKLEDIIPFVYEQGQSPLILILDRITDVRNFGAIVRTAECAGVHAVVIPLKGSAQINADAIKTSSGALYKVPVCREVSLKKCIHFLQDSGVQVVVCTEKTNDTLYEIDFKVPTAIVMGSEEDGVTPELLRSAPYLAKIPMLGEISSLNVSVSAGIILYEAVRQRF